MIIRFKNLLSAFFIWITVLTLLGHAQDDFKCGFADIILKKRTVSKQSPEDYQHSFVTPEGHFIIYYDTSGINIVNSRDEDQNGIPDFVEITGYHAEKAWSLMIDTLGFHRPYLQNGEFVTCYPLYLKKISDYGVTSFYEGLEVTSVPGINYESWIELNTSYPFAGHLSEDPWVRDSMGVAVTISHEFFHAIQLGYHVRFNGSAKDNDLWWMEASAVFFEEFCTPQINDYIEYLPSFYNTLDMPVYQYYSLRIYGEVQIPFYLEKSFGRAFMENIWSRIIEKNAVDVISDFLEERDHSWEKMLAIVGGWISRGGITDLPVLNHIDQEYWPEFDDYTELQINDKKQINLEYHNPFSIALGKVNNISGSNFTAVSHFGGNSWFIAVPGESGDIIVDDNLSISFGQYPDADFYKISVGWGGGDNNGENYLRLENSKFFMVYPNPLKLFKHQQIGFISANMIKKVKIISLNGECLFEGSGEDRYGEVYFPVDQLPGNLKTGVYFFQIISDEVQTGKLFVIN